MTQCPPWVATWRARMRDECWRATDAVLASIKAMEQPDGTIAGIRPPPTFSYVKLVPNASAPVRPREPASRVLTWPWDATKEKP